jgi:uncharacterized protein (DUF1015 family)
LAKIKAFKGVRPVRDKVASVACRPYDVLSSEEARIEAAENPLSFLHVVKPEIDFPEVQDPYALEIYQKGRDNFLALEEKGIFQQDEEEAIYIYRLTYADRSQTGIVACASVEDYFNDIIRKHELTRPVKENDRKNHVRISGINAEPVFFAFKAVKRLDEISDEIVKSKPEYNFTASDEVRHELWKVTDPQIVREIIDEFDGIKYTYVADGHHRTAAAALTGKELRDENPHHTGDESYNYFLAVHFPHNQLEIIDYNRVVTDLNNLTVNQFLERLEEKFEVSFHQQGAFKPNELHTFGMYLDGKWYALKAKSGTFNIHDPVEVLDVSILSAHILEPILDITDLRNDKRIDFVGGIRGMSALEELVDSGKMKIAFSLYPVSMDQLMDIADSGEIMPPKTTWFEPKLRSGLVVHKLQ